MEWKEIIQKSKTQQIVVVVFSLLFAALFYFMFADFFVKLTTLYSGSMKDYGNALATDSNLRSQIFFMLTVSFFGVFVIVPLIILWGGWVQARQNNSRLLDAVKLGSLMGIEAYIAMTVASIFLSLSKGIFPFSLYYVFSILLMALIGAISCVIGAYLARVLKNKESSKKK